MAEVFSSQVLLSVLRSLVVTPPRPGSKPVNNAGAWRAIRANLGHDCEVGQTRFCHWSFYLYKTAEVDANEACGSQRVNSQGSPHQ